MIKKYFRIFRSYNDKAQGGYYFPFTEKEIRNAVDGEMNGIEEMTVGESFTVKVIEMEEEDYLKLPEFLGW